MTSITRLVAAGVPGTAVAIGPKSPSTGVVVSQSAPNSLLSVQLFADARGGLLIADWSARLDSGDFSLNEHGFEVLTATVPMALDEASRMLYLIRNAVVVVGNGAAVAWLGRVRGSTVTNKGLAFRALGPWVGLTDTLYTQFWSESRYGEWQEVVGSVVPGRHPEKYSLDNNNRLYIAPSKGLTFATGGDVGEWLYQVPDKGGYIGQFQCTYDLFAPAGWVFKVQGYDSGVVTEFNSLIATGSLQRGALYLPGGTIGATAGILISLYNDSGVPSAISNDTGVYYLRLTDVRLTAYTPHFVDTTSSTAVTLSVNTTVAAAITAGVGVSVAPASMTNITAASVLEIQRSGDGLFEEVTVSGVTGTTFVADFANSYAGGATVRKATAVAITPADMTGIYVGQRLTIETGHASNGETVTVTAVTASTFTADFYKPHSAGFAINAPLVYAGYVVENVLASVRSVNETALSATIALIDDPAVDRLNLIFEDVRPSEVLNELAAKGDNQTPPNLYAAAVWEDAILRFQPRGTGGRTWVVDVVEVEAETSLDEVENEVYSKYEVNGRALRSNVTTDSYSVRVTGFTRQAVVEAGSAVEGEVFKSAVLADKAGTQVKARIQTRGLYDSSGGWHAPWRIRPGDTLVSRNLPPTFLGGLTDAVRRFRVGRVSCNFEQVRVEPETPIPTLEFLIATGAE